MDLVAGAKPTAGSQAFFPTTGGALSAWTSTAVAVHVRTGRSATPYQGWRVALFTPARCFPGPTGSPRVVRRGCHGPWKHRDCQQFKRLIIHSDGGLDIRLRNPRLGWPRQPQPLARLQFTENAVTTTTPPVLIRPGPRHPRGRAGGLARPPSALRPRVAVVK